MTRVLHPLRAVARFRRDETGSTLVELAIVVPLFFLIFFGLLDFGRMGYRFVIAEKAMQEAARVAAVRPAACGGVPQSYASGGNTNFPFGTDCSAGANICAAPATVTCLGNAGNPTALEVWNRMEPVLPNAATIANLRFSYAYDPNMGFLGGPYVPVVTVEIVNLDFQFATPLGGLASMATNSGSSTLSTTIPFPNFSVSLPAEDLNQGEAG